MTAVLSNQKCHITMIEFTNNNHNFILSVEQICHFEEGNWLHQILGKYQQQIEAGKHGTQISCIKTL